MCVYVCGVTDVFTFAMGAVVSVCVWEGGEGGGSMCVHVYVCVCAREKEHVFGFLRVVITVGEYLLSKGAKDTIVNRFGLTCYEGVSPEHNLLAGEQEEQEFALDVPP